MKLVLKVVFMILDWVLYFAYNLFTQFLFVLFGFWFGFMGGALAQRMDYTDGLANQLMGILGAMWLVSYISFTIVKALTYGGRVSRPNHADTIAKIRARLGFAPRRDDTSEVQA